MPLQDFRGRIRFGSFELDLQTRELRKDGRPVKLQDQPGKLLALLACRAGELVTRTEIEKALWREGEFVEFEHAVNTAVRKIREALGDDPEKPRFIETLPRKGYRFIATVETAAAEAPSRADLESSQADRGIRDEGPRQSIPVSGDSEDNAPAAKAGSEVSNPEVVTSGTTRHYFSLPRSLARSLFLVAQGGYLAIYCAALYKAEAV